MAFLLYIKKRPPHSDAHPEFQMYSSYIDWENLFFIFLYYSLLIVLWHYSIEHQILIAVVLQTMAVSRWAIMAVARIEYLHGVVILHGSNS